MTEDTIEEGWAFPANARRAHYMRDTMALCRRYGFYTGPLQADNGKPSKDDCTACRKALEAERARTTEEGTTP